MMLGVLTSGELGVYTLRQISENYKIGFVLTDSKSLDVINFCQEKNIPFFKGNPRDGKGFEFIKNIEVDIIASINYLFLIENDIINHSTHLTFNIHGSLLPKYRGRTPHVWSIINNEKITGITAHIIDSGCDTGDIISQIEIPIGENDTGNDVLEKYKNEYFNLVETVILKFKQGKIQPFRQNIEEATYFGKRTPDDGEINWHWQKERIKNWVRAQSKPYPGAYTFYLDKKIIIDEVKYSNCGYSNDMENGVILANSPKIIVKTPNGAIELIKIRGLFNPEIGSLLK